MSGDSQLPTLVDIAGDLVSAIDGVPAPIKRNMFKALNSLITGIADVPAAYLEMKAAEFRTRQRGHNIVMTAAAQNAAKRAGKSPELADRALTYFANDLVREQSNREAVVLEAIKATSILERPQKDPPPIDDDWLHQFRRLASSKSHAELQAILGRILAGEVQQPGSFAPYTLEVIARLDQGTAQSFEFVASHAIIIPGQWDLVISSILAENGVNHDDLLNYTGGLLHLASCGLVTSPGAQIDPEGVCKLPESSLGGQSVSFGKCEPSIIKWAAPMKGDIVFLTQAGHQLQSIIPKTFSINYARQLQIGLERLGVAITFSGIDLSVPEQHASSTEDNPEV